VVERRGWLTREHFVQLIGVTNLLPGPNSSEVAIHVGYTQRGWTGALATGLSFLIPTFVLVTALSWLYFGYGTLPRIESLFLGLKPAVLALIVWAGLKLGRTAVTRALLWALAAAGAVVGAVAGGWAVLAMLAGGLVTWAGWKGKGDAEDDGGERRGAVFPIPLTGLVSAASPVLAGSTLATLAAVLWTHLWIGGVLFGGGYVLVALLEPQAVGRFGWLTAAQFLDGVALTQAVPGPISTLSAFVGYAAGGLPAAFLATAGVYLPAFAAVLVVAPHLERLRSRAPVRAALEGVSAVAAGAILGVAVTLAPSAVPDAFAGAVFAAAVLALWRLGVATPWIVLGGLGAGVLRMLLG
jgi:chromate transporter